MKLYHLPVSTYSQKAIIALKEKEVKYESEIVPLFNPEGKEKYREIYPICKVPLLILDNGHKIPESSIIVEYIDTHFKPEQRLVPMDDPEVSRKVRFTDRMIDLHLNDSVVGLFFQSRKPENERSQENINTWTERTKIMYQFMDQDLADKNWMMGDEFTVADCAAAGPLALASQVIPFGDYPNIMAYFDRISTRPSVRETLAEAQEFLAANPM